MTEKEKRARLESELNAIVDCIVSDTVALAHDASILIGAIRRLGEDEKTIKSISGPLRRYGGEHAQTYSADVLNVVDRFAPTKPPKPRRDPKPPPLPANVTPLFH